MENSSEIIMEKELFLEVIREKEKLIFEIENFIKKYVSGKKKVLDTISEWSLEEGSLIVTFDQFKEIVELDGINIEKAEHIGIGLIDMVYQRVYLSNKKGNRLVRKRRR